MPEKDINFLLREQIRKLPCYRNGNHSKVFIRWAEEREITSFSVFCDASQSHIFVTLGEKISSN